MADTSTMRAAEKDVDTHRYEGMFLLDSGRFSSDPDGATKELLSILQKVGATVDMHRHWQDGKLAYEVDGHRRGVHYLVFFRMPTEKAGDLNRLCKLNELVVRHLLIRQDQQIYDASVHALSPDAGGGAAEETEERPPRRRQAEDARRSNEPNEEED